MRYMWTLHFNAATTGGGRKKYSQQKVRAGLLVRLGPPPAPGWPETESPRKTVANSGVETQLGALGTHVVVV